MKNKKQEKGWFVSYKDRRTNERVVRFSGMTLGQAKFWWRWLCRQSPDENPKIGFQEKATLLSDKIARK
jgi:hypothetical protein